MVSRTHYFLKETTDIYLVFSKNWVWELLVTGATPELLEDGCPAHNNPMVQPYLPLKKLGVAGAMSKILKFLRKLG